ncbi:DEAD/DEAH box helicase [Candidatus Woesearchaeota archaeon]|nr:DEAD/DEAH box helicase [Candidatus Woesearchaeota archaeon]
MQFKGLTLDDFQIRAIRQIENNNSVVVSAPTGTGKTLIADYTISKFLNAKRRVIYTAPIKALSNQKYKDFTKDYGKEMVGIMTGDIVINPEAPLLVMTTEIYRNMLLTHDAVISYVSYVIFDEIHYISDPERGTVWEESIIFSPQNIRYLCLSATIPNAAEFAEWISSIKAHPVIVVDYDKRAVPLKHYVYDKSIGLFKTEDLAVSGIQPNPLIRGQNTADHMDVVRQLKDKMPAIFFVFNRKNCEKFARELSKDKDYTTKQQKAEIISYTREHVSKEVSQMNSYARLKSCIVKGVAYHHAGLLPNLKEIVEGLFEKGLIYVLYATETFAVGVNMPAKTVCFNSLEKYDGISFRYLNSKEYFQLAGRAGRRGIDKEGTVIALIDRRRADVARIKQLVTKDIEPIVSEFRLSVNTVLNLVKNHNDDEIDTILKSNFDYFLRMKSEHQVRIMASFNNKLKKLTAMGYITHEKKLTQKGEFACHVYFEELLISEIFYSQMYKKLSETEINCLIAAIVYEEKRMDMFRTKGAKNQYEHILRVIGENKYVDSTINKRSIFRLVAMISSWSNNGNFTDVLTTTNLLEGDIIRLFRRMIDIQRQIIKATSNNELRDKIVGCLKKIDRDIVRAEFEE